MSGINPLAMSDEDFLKQPVPEMGQASSQEDTTQPQIEQPAAPVQEEQNAGTPAEEADPEADKPAEPAADEGDEPAGSSEDEPKDGDKPAGEGDKPEDQAGDKPKPDAAAPAAGAEDADKTKPGEPAAQPAGTDQPQRPDAAGLEQFYDQIMAPFNANGKQIRVKDHKEALQLMQMGANYTQKMQQLAPHRKALAMLENNQLLDPDKLSFLIDLDKKNPEAIKQLIKESGIDPLDIDMNTEPSYQAGSHKVSDNDVSFKEHLQSLASSETGLETLKTLETWDQPSVDELWKQPELIPIFHQHREAGIYDQIATEVERRKVLGQLGPNVRFIDAYKIVGDDLHNAGVLKDPLANEKPADAGTAPQPQVENKPQPQPIATGTAPAPADDAASKAASAAQTRATTRTAKPSVNYLAMSDEEFLKAEALMNRV